MDLEREAVARLPFHIHMSSNIECVIEVYSMSMCLWWRKFIHVYVRVCLSVLGVYVRSRSNRCRSTAGRNDLVRRDAARTSVFSCMERLSLGFWQLVEYKIYWTK